MRMKTCYSHLFKVPLWHYIVGSGVGVVEDGLHELFADFGYAVNVRVYAEAENRGLCGLSKSIGVFPYVVSTTR